MSLDIKSWTFRLYFHFIENIIWIECYTFKLQACQWFADRFGQKRVSHPQLSLPNLPCEEFLSLWIVKIGCWLNCLSSRVTNQVRSQRRRVRKSLRCEQWQPRKGKPKVTESVEIDEEGKAHNQQRKQHCCEWEVTVGLPHWEGVCSEGVGVNLFYFHYISPSIVHNFLNNLKFLRKLIN